MAPITLRLLIHPDTKENLMRLADKLGALAPSGPRTGAPSISTLLKQIASGEITLTRPRK